MQDYDQLLIATGARPLCPEVAGFNVEGIFGLSTLASGIRIQQFIEQTKPRKAVVVGGGYMGLEMAEALVRQKLDVSLGTTRSFCNQEWICCCRFDR